jgi:ankyrin repeat protein
MPKTPRNKKKRMYGGNAQLLQKLKGSISEGDVDLFEETLKELNKDVNTLLIDGNKIMNYIIDTGYDFINDFIKILLINGINVNLRNDEGDWMSTPVISAIKNTNADTLFLLLRHGAILPTEREKLLQIYDMFYSFEPSQSDRLSYFNWRDTFQVLYSQIKQNQKLENAKFMSNFTYNTGFDNEQSRRIGEHYNKQQMENLSSDRINAQMAALTSYIDRL